MKKPFLIVTIIVFLVVLLISWQSLKDYKKYKSIYVEPIQKLTELLDMSLGNAVLEEFMLRSGAENLNKEVWGFIPKENADTSIYEYKTITMQDTMFRVRILSHDIMARIRINQFIFKGFKSVDLKQLNDILIHDLHKQNVTVKQSYIEYIDLKKGKVISHSESEKPTQCLRCSESNIYPLDILDSVGVKAYVEIEIPSVFQHLKSELIILGCMVLVFFLCLFLLLRYGED